VKVNPLTTAFPVQPSKLRGIEEAPSDKQTLAAYSAPQEVAVASVTSPSPLSAETKKDLALATQEIASNSEHTHKTPPAQQARAALADNPELGALPFGALVSAIARGEPLPTPVSSWQSNEEPEPPLVTDELTDTPPTDLAAGDQSPTTGELIVDELASALVSDPIVEEILNPPDVP
jgi:hypothetical protein